MTKLIVPPSVIQEKIQKDFKMFFAYARREAGPNDYQAFEDSLVTWLTSLSGEGRDEAYRTMFDRHPVEGREVLSSRGKAKAKRMLANFQEYRSHFKKSRKRKSGIIELGS